MEKPPKITKEIESKALDLLNSNAQFAILADKANEDYGYWSDLKYKVKAPIQPEVFWAAVKIKRSACRIIHTPVADFRFLLTATMEKLCFDICEAIGDKSHGGSLISFAKDFEFLMKNEISYEAISSSVMEGAATTRKVALEMIGKRKPPKNVSEQMIWNNYLAMQYIIDNCGKDIDANMLLEIHRIVTERTLDNPEDELCFRYNNNIDVVDTENSESVHTPPSYEKIAETVDWLCRFVNNETGPFVNPVIKAIIAHFSLSYLHPFVDGNGRTARALFYFCMAKAGYPFVKYISISTAISFKRKQYDKAFLECENDNLDIGYFILYHLKMVYNAIEWTRGKISKSKDEAKREIDKYRKGLSPMQSEIIGKMVNGDWLYADAASVSLLLNVSHPTAMKLLKELEKLGLVERTQHGKRKQTFVLSNVEIKL